MKIKYVKGDLLKTQRQIIAHGCNASGGFGSGVAGQIARFIPSVRKAYLDKFKTEGFTLGDVQIVELELPFGSIKYVGNIIGQQTYGRTGIHADLSAIERGICKVLDFCVLKNLSGVAVPMIGSGYGGLKFSEVEKIMLEASNNHKVMIDVHYL